MKTKPIPTEVKNLFSKLMKCKSHSDIAGIMFINKELLDTLSNYTFEEFMKMEVLPCVFNEQNEEELMLDRTKVKLKQFKNEFYYSKYGFI